MRTILVALACAAALFRGAAASDLVVGQAKVSALPGAGLTLPDYSLFGISVCPIGDLDGDGVVEVAAGAYVEADGGPERGALYVFFMKPDGSWKSFQKISSTQGGFSAQIDDGDGFGNAIAALGDLDHDGIPDVAVGSWLDDDGGCCPGADRGAIYILFLKANGTVKAWRKISSTSGGFPASAIDDGDRFGQSLCTMGDLDGDGIVDLAVGALYDSDGKLAPNTQINSGAFYILYLSASGAVKSWSKVSNLYGNLGATLLPQDRFGYSATNLLDLDLDGVDDIAVGAVFDSDGGLGRGAVYNLLLTPAGTVKNWVKFSCSPNGTAPPGLFMNAFDDQDLFGASVARLDDLDGDGVQDLAVGAPGDDDDVVPNSESEAGGIYVLFLRNDGRCKGYAKISLAAGGFQGLLENSDRFGQSLAVLGDLNGDGTPELAAGAIGDDDGGPERGAFWIMSLAHGPFVQLQGALEGAAGKPALFATGSLQAGSPTTLQVQHAAPAVPLFLLVAATPAYLPLYDGWLVPSLVPPAFALPFATDAGGSLTFAFPWPPNLPSGVSLWFQGWLADPGAPSGAAATNGLLLTIP